MFSQNSPLVETEIVEAEAEENVSSFESACHSFTHNRLVKIHCTMAKTIKR
jgi:hypothetical protein